MEAAGAAAGAMVYVNTVVLVQARLGLGEDAVALAFAGFGAGSMLAAFLLPRILERLEDRPVMIGGAALMVAGVALGLIAVLRIWPALDLAGLPHDRSGLPPDHPHFAEHGPQHSHPYVIDDLHRRWPRVA